MKILVTGGAVVRDRLPVHMGEQRDDRADAADDVEQRERHGKPELPVPRQGGHMLPLRQEDIECDDRVPQPALSEAGGPCQQRRADHAEALLCEQP